jgi:hypothetical protein
MVNKYFTIETPGKVPDEEQESIYHTIEQGGTLSIESS